MSHSSDCKAMSYAPSGRPKGHNPLVNVPFPSCPFSFSAWLRLRCLWHEKWVRKGYLSTQSFSLGPAPHSACSFPLQTCPRPGISSILGSPLQVSGLHIRHLRGPCRDSDPIKHCPSLSGSLELRVAQGSMTPLLLNPSCI